MRIRLQRLPQAPNSTPGDLFVDEVACGVTLELPVRDGKPGSAIPPGVYAVNLTPSPKFMRVNDDWVRQYAHQMPHIDGIPGRSLIMFHWGNRPSDTDGCVLIGNERLGADFITGSRSAFTRLFDKIAEPARRGECDVEIIDAMNDREQVSGAVTGEQ